jgi:hypothetical protein
MPPHYNSVPGQQKNAVAVDYERGDEKPEWIGKLFSG